MKKIRTMIVTKDNLKSFPGCILTASGVLFDLMNPVAIDIRLSDIAHGLSNNCRFNGHTQTFYSVAEHCVRMHDMVPDHLRALALLHDAEEAYWGDIVYPLKVILKDLAPDITDRMRHLRTLILDKFGVEWCDEIKEWDNNMLMWEFDNVVSRTSNTTMYPEVAAVAWEHRVRIALLK